MAAIMRPIEIITYLTRLLHCKSVKQCSDKGESKVLIPTKQIEPGSLKEVDDNIMTRGYENARNIQKRKRTQKGAI